MVYLRAPYSYSTVQIAQSATLTCVLRWNDGILISKQVPTSPTSPTSGPSPTRAATKSAHRKEYGRTEAGRALHAPARRGRSKDLLSHSKSAAEGSVGRFQNLAPTPRVTVLYFSTPCQKRRSKSVQYATPQQLL
jgi:hypothetical protein